jgi:hypothetical protein
MTVFSNLMRLTITSASLVVLTYEAAIISCTSAATARKATWVKTARRNPPSGRARSASAACPAHSQGQRFLHVAFAQVTVNSTSELHA